MKSWLSADIPNPDIALPNYLLFHHDCNCHSGGIVVFVKSHFIVSEVYVSLKIEFFLLSIKLNYCSFSIGTYYWSPSSPDNLDHLFDKLTSLNPSTLSNLILLGNFNINFYSTSSSKTKLDTISDTFDPKQIVYAPTHFSHTNTPSNNDLVWKNSNIVPIPKSKTSSSSPSDYCPISLLSLPSNVTSLTICKNFVLLTSFLIVSLVFDQDSQLKQLYYLLSILGFLHWITKMQSVAFSSISLKHLTLSLTSLCLTLYLRLTFLLFFCLGSIVICKAILNK